MNTILFPIVCAFDADYSFFDFKFLWFVACTWTSPAKPQSGCDDSGQLVALAISSILFFLRQLLPDRRDEAGRSMDRNIVYTCTFTLPAHTEEIPQFVYFFLEIIARVVRGLLCIRCLMLMVCEHSTLKLTKQYTGFFSSSRLVIRFSTSFSLLLYRSRYSS